MTSDRRVTVVRTLLFVLAPILTIAILRPWSVRPIEGDQPVAFDAATFASSAWPRVVRAGTDAAADVSEVPSGNGTTQATARMVKGSGVVSAIDRRSRVGVMLVRATGAKQVTVAIQIGPVLRGTALRDASGFIHFSDFTNQSDYAAAANALNDAALRTVLAPLEIDTLQGRAVVFAGAVGRSAPREDGAIEIVPVRLEVAEANAK
jgi:predicted lipoprotein